MAFAFFLMPSLQNGLFDQIPMGLTFIHGTAEIVEAMVMTVILSFFM
jgi:hypothetical protein